MRDFDTFLLACGNTDNICQLALLLYEAGHKVRENITKLPDVGGESDFELAKERLTQYFEPQKTADMKCTTTGGLNRGNKNH